jgi:branched-chain amino acid transport system substrate-binding protein
MLSRRTASRAAVILVAAAALAPLASGAQPQTSETIRIGIIAEQSAIGGIGIVRGAQLAADTINAAGGVDGRQLEIITYDNHSSVADSVRAFQRATTSAP